MDLAHLDVVFGHGLEPLGAQGTAAGEACYPLPSICGRIIQRTLQLEKQTARSKNLRDREGQDSLRRPSDRLMCTPIKTLDLELRSTSMQLGLKSRHYSLS